MRELIASVWVVLILCGMTVGALSGWKKGMSPNALDGDERVSNSLFGALLGFIIVGCGPIVIGFMACFAWWLLGEAFGR